MAACWIGCDALMGASVAVLIVMETTGYPGPGPVDDAAGVDSRGDRLHRAEHHRPDRAGAATAIEVVALTGGRQYRTAGRRCRRWRRDRGDRLSRPAGGSARGPGGSGGRGRGRAAALVEAGAAGRLGDVGHRRRGRAGAGAGRWGRARRWRWPTRNRWSAPAGWCWPDRARSGARILPVDSEHSAVFQALVGEDGGRGAGDHHRLGRRVPGLAAGKAGPGDAWPRPRPIPTGTWASASPSIQRVDVQQGAGTDRDAGVFRR
jgi:hypothetical protein